MVKNFIKFFSLENLATKQAELHEKIVLNSPNLSKIQGIIIILNHCSSLLFLCNEILLEDHEKHVAVQAANEQNLLVKKPAAQKHVSLKIIQSEFLHRY